jgi:hypothetical protein
LFDFIRARSQYRQGFQTGYDAGRLAVSAQAHHDVRQAIPGDEAARRWLDSIARDTHATGRSAGGRPPWYTSTFHTPTGHVLAAAGPGGAGLRGASGHPVRDVAGFAHSVGQADGRTAARQLTARDLYADAERRLGRRQLIVNGRRAAQWLLDARQRWVAAGSGGPSPLPGSHAEAVYRDLAFQAGQEASLPEQHHHHQQPQRSPHAAARPGPGAAVGQPPHGRPPVVPPAAPTPPLRPPGLGR